MTMTCPSFGTSSEVSLWYALESGSATPIPDGSAANKAFVWNNIPITGETLNTNLSSAISNQITSNRSYANSKLSQGEVSGTISYEMSSNQFCRNMLISAMQARPDPNLGTDLVTGTTGVVISAAGVSAAASRTITLTGLSVVVGASYSVIVDNRDIIYVAVTNDTLSLIATALATKIGALPGVVASATGGVITITSGLGIADISFTSFALAAWAPDEIVTNASKKSCYTMMKRVARQNGKFDYYIFRGCQISSLTLEFKTGSIVTASSKVLGIRPETPLSDVSAPAHWHFRAPLNVPLFSSVDSMKYFYVTGDDGVDTGVTMQDLTVTLDNNLYQQLAIGNGNPFSAGIASSRFSATLSGSAYYDTPKIYTNFISDTPLRISFRLVDENTDGYLFTFPFCKVTGGALPEASAPDESMMIKTEFRAFEQSGASNGTVRVRRQAF